MMQWVLRRMSWKHAAGFDSLSLAECCLWSELFLINYE